MKKVILIVLPLLLIGGGGGVFFLAKSGKINIPGVTPKKNAALAQYASDKQGDDIAKKAVESKPKPKPKPAAEPKIAKAPAPPTEDPKLGQSAIASLWNEMKLDPLEKIVKDWKDEDLAPIFAQMDAGKVGQLLAKIAETDAKRASRLTRALQKEESKLDQSAENPA